MKTCKECNVSIESGKYCKLCAPQMIDGVTNKGGFMSNLETQRKELIEKLYGLDAVAEDARGEDWTMCRERNFRQVAYEATMSGRQLEDVLSRSEIEDLSREDADYEPVERDLLDHGKHARDVYTRCQIVALMRKANDIAEDETVEDNVVPDVAEKKVFISEEQKQTNYDFYVRRVKEATKASTISWIGKMVFDAIQGSMRKWTDAEGNEVEAPTFFPRGKTKEFWAIYKDAKENFSGDYKLVLSEVEDVIANCEYPSEVKRVKQSIYADKRLNFSDKKMLWAKCDEVITAMTA